MKKLCVILLICILTPSSCFGAFFKKDKEETDRTSRGYVGTLPDLTKEYKPGESGISTPVFDKTTTFHSENSIKPIPRDDPAFVNIILKKETTSPYIADLQEFIDMLEQIFDSIENNENIQRFAARVYFLNINTEHFKQKYADRPESSYISYEKIIELSEKAKAVSDLRSEAEKYKKYLAYNDTGAVYSPNNIDMQMSDLKVSLEHAINLLKNTH